MRYLFALPLVALFACSETPEPVKPINWTKEQSTDLGKDLAAQEEIDIKLFLVQHSDWKVEKSATGLRHWIYEKSNGAPATGGNIANVEMKVMLLDSTVVYETKSDEYVELRIDKSEIESGVNEGLKLMKVGEKAKLIVPSHLGQGLVGDFDKIPPLSVLVVDLHLIGIE